MELAKTEADLHAPDMEEAAPGLRASRTRHLLVLGVLALLAFMAFKGVFTSILDGAVGSHIEQVNRQYLQAADRSTTQLLEVLSAAKVALAILTSSKGGISFFIDIEVQLGQSLSAIYETVNYAWMFTLASLAATKILDLLLDVSRISMAPVLMLFFCCTGLWYGLRSRFPAAASAFSGAAGSLLFAVVLVHGLVPLSIYGTAVASQHVFQPRKNEVYQRFASVQALLPQPDAPSNLNSQVKKSITYYQQSSLPRSAGLLSDVTARHIVGAVAEYVLVPLGLLYALSALALQVIRRLWPK
ncbi:hypothetical protein [Massilia endophytica]|uniref:hypothetical protein n=1 Tax=Massilia endophytica TaxID=2899220 RepID=UPI001E6442D8|nr:hypothetical protein [Massilia endophytica]UGQ45897.1 hypothetical protein LSQ66_19225 [Massilia endophytica]